MPDIGAPFAGYEAYVVEDWLDYNGHMHDASYATVLSDANEVMFEALDLSADYRDRSGAAYYTVDTRIRFLAECSLGQRLTALTTMIAADRKKVRLYTEIYVDVDTLAATGESLYLHVDPSVGGTTPLPDDRWAEVESVLSAHAKLPRSPHLGLGVGVRP